MMGTILSAHFTGEKTKIEKGYVTGPKSYTVRARI